MLQIYQKSVVVAENRHLWTLNCMWLAKLYHLKTKILAMTFTDDPSVAGGWRVRHSDNMKVIRGR